MNNPLERPKCFVSDSLFNIEHAAFDGNGIGIGIGIAFTDSSFAEVLIFI